MDKNKGWIKLYRSIEDHWLWQNEKFNNQSAWIDILLMVNHEPKKIHVANEILEIKTGQRWTSIRQLAQRWRWSEKRVLSFLNLLQSDGMIYKDSTSKGTLLTVVNYGDFQGHGNTLDNTNYNTKETPTTTQTTTQITDKQEVKNDIRMKSTKKNNNGRPWQ